MNPLHQYTNRTVPGYLDVQGDANSNATVNSATAYRCGAYCINITMKISFAFILICLFAAGASCKRKPDEGIVPNLGTEYRTFSSPDGRYKIVVYRLATPMAMPGQAGDAPGTVCLYEAASGKILERKKTEMVQTIDQITWSATNVDIKLFADWKLR